MSFFTWPPHEEHFLIGESLNFCIASNSLPHFKHLYS